MNYIKSYHNPVCLIIEYSREYICNQESHLFGDYKHQCLGGISLSIVLEIERRIISNPTLHSMIRMLSIVISLYMEEVSIHHNREHMYLLLPILAMYHPMCIFIMFILLWYSGYQPPAMPTQDSAPSVGYRPPLFPGSAELAEVVPEPEVEETEKKSVDTDS